MNRELVMRNVEFQIDALSKVIADEEKRIDAALDWLHEMRKTRSKLASAHLALVEASLDEE